MFLDTHWMLVQCMRGTVLFSSVAQDHTVQNTKNKKDKKVKQFGYNFKIYTKITGKQFGTVHMHTFERRQASENIWLIQKIVFITLFRNLGF